MISKRRQSLLVNGNQTSGNIFDIKNDDTYEIQKIIRSEIEKYRTKYIESEEGLIKKMPAEYNLYGWLISMKSGGNLKPHIHSEGWLSGSIYILMYLEKQRMTVVIWLSPLAKKMTLLADV